GRNCAEMSENTLKKGSTVCTDALMSYDDLDRDYDRRVIDHAESYAQGHVHTNCLENFWSLVKRAIKGTYVNVEPFHLFRYLDEQAFRYNARKVTDASRFLAVLRTIVGRRLTYKALIADASTSNVRPVTLAPGRARLVTRPAATGSTPTVMMIGMVVVAFLAARVVGLVDVTITSTPECTSSVARSG